MAAARVRREGDFPATLGERVFVGSCVALPCALVPGVLTFYVVGLGAALVVSAAAVAGLVVYISHLLSTAPPAEQPTVVPVSERRCRECGAPFTPIRSNQVYCGRECRTAAAAWRRRARVVDAERPTDGQGPPPVRDAATLTQMEAATRRASRLPAAGHTDLR